jgi:uncharacterized delta-60 repeat protein
MHRIRLFAICFVVFMMVFSLSACGCGDDDDSGSDDAAADDATDDTAGDDDAGDDTGNDDDSTDDDDAAAPSVLGTIPADGDIEVPLATSIEVTFSAPMNAASVEENFNLGGLPGIFEWNPAGDTVTFTPTDILEEGQEYTVFIGSGATDAADAALAESYSAVFTTVDLWTITIDGGAGEDDLGSGIAIDQDGNFYMSGQLSPTIYGSDIWISAYDSTATELWTRTVNGPAADNDYGHDIAADSAGNAYVVGTISVSDFNNDMWTRKYDSFTSEEWTQTFGDISLGSDQGNGIAVDGDGNVISVGIVDFGSGDFDILIRKYNSEGVIQWMRSEDSGDNNYDSAQDVAVDANGNIYVVGTTQSTGSESDAWIRKLDASGTTQWTRVFNGADDMSDRATGVTVDTDGFVYVTGSTYVNGQHGNIWIIKYNNEGIEEWTVTVDGPEHQNDFGEAIAADDQGNVYVTGSLESLTTYEDIWVGMFDSQGNELWTHTVADVDEGGDRGKDIALDANGNIYVIGYVYTNAENRNIWIRKYDPDGHWAE